MPLIHPSDAPVFDVGDATITGLASPSRGAQQVCAWHVVLAPGADVAEHRLDREEVLVVTDGHLAVRIAGEDAEVGAGGAVVVPPDTWFALGNRGQEPVRFVAALTPGVTASMGDGTTLAPPWAE